MGKTDIPTSGFNLPRASNYTEAVVTSPPHTANFYNVSFPQNGVLLFLPPRPLCSSGLLTFLSYGTRQLSLQLIVVNFCPNRNYYAFMHINRFHLGKTQH